MSRLSGKSLSLIKKSSLPSRGRKISDSSLPGFYALVLPSGITTFWVRFRLQNGRRRQLRVGDYSLVGVDAARTKAREILARASLGADPVTERDRARSMPTWGEWVTTYLMRVEVMKNDSYHDRLHLNREKRWKTIPLDAMSRADIETARYALARIRTGATVNRFTDSVRACLSAAMRDGLIDRHPALRLQPFPETPRSRVPTDEEMTLLLKAIEAEGEAWGRTALLLLIQTGARRSEVLRARWADVDLTGGVWTIPSPKSGHPQVIPLASNSIALLESVPRRSLHVIADSNGKPKNDLRGPWTRVLVRAGLLEAGIRIHDLRRRFGLDVARSAGLHIASKLLRHSSVAVTERHYVPLGMDLLRSSVEQLAEVVTFRAVSRERPSG